MPSGYRAPFVRILPPFILGIVLAHFQKISIPLSLAILLALALILILFRFLPNNFKYKFSWTKGILLAGFIFIFGAGLYSIKQIENHPLWYNQNREAEYVRAQITNSPEEKAKTLKAQCQIVSSLSGSKKRRKYGLFYAYLQKGNKSSTLKQGDEITILNQLQEIKDAGNPGEFKYSQFVQNKQIFDRVFLKDSEWFLSKKSEIGIQHFFASLSDSLRKTLTQYIPNPQSAGIAQALLVGYRSEIDKDTYEAYTKTGLVHLIAISGLHMGIFYYGLLGLLQLFPILKQKKKLCIAVSLMGMWFFASLTAFPPSVLRASIMFTLLGIGSMLSQKSNSLNYLLASAFILLCYNPNYLFEPGFQLSYAAVLGILFFFKPIHNKLQSKWSFANWISKIVSLSIAAQIFTLPISIYYFHNLPLLFFITNVVAIPMVTIIIYGELLLVLFSAIPFIATPVGKIVSSLLSALNRFIEWASELSFISASNISINFWQTILLLFIGISLGMFLLKNSKRAFVLSLLACVIFIGSAIQQKWTHLNQHEIVIYNSSKAPLIEVFKGNTFHLADNVEPAENENVQDYIIKPAHLYYQAQHYDSSLVTKASNEFMDIFSVHNKRIGRLRKAYKLMATEPINLDYLIISDKYVKNIPQLLEHFPAKELILDGTLSLWKIDALQKELSELDLPVHIMRHDGAKIISL